MLVQNHQLARRGAARDERGNHQVRAQGAQAVCWTAIVREDIRDEHASRCGSRRGTGRVVPFGACHDRRWRAGVHEILRKIPLNALHALFMHRPKGQFGDGLTILVVEIFYPRGQVKKPLCPHS